MVSELNHIEQPALFILADSPHKCGQSVGKNSSLSNCPLTALVKMARTSTFLSPLSDLNRRPSLYKSGALPLS